MRRRLLVTEAAYPRNLLTEDLILFLVIKTLTASNGQRVYSSLSKDKETTKSLVWQEGERSEKTRTNICDNGLKTQKNIVKGNSFSGERFLLDFQTWLTAHGKKTKISTRDATGALLLRLVISMPPNQDYDRNLCGYVTVLT